MRDEIPRLADVSSGHGNWFDLERRWRDKHASLTARIAELEELNLLLTQVDRDRHATLTAERDALREALTPSAETKSAYIGEFKFSIPIALEDGEEGSQPVVVPWTTVKEIMAASRARAALRGKEGE